MPPRIRKARLPEASRLPVAARRHTGRVARNPYLDALRDMIGSMDRDINGCPVGRSKDARAVTVPTEDRETERMKIYGASRITRREHGVRAAIATEPLDGGQTVIRFWAEAVR